MNIEIAQHLKHNLIVNILDGGFFGLAMGFASYSTILPLFVNTMTRSALLIGLIPALHSACWYLPQLFMARRVARQKSFKPMVLLLTTFERLPFLGLALVAGQATQLGSPLALGLTFTMITFQSLGAGFTANAWQSMIAKIIPGEQRGTFFGFQAATASLFASGSAVVAGFILEKFGTSRGFVSCFLLASVALALSWFFLALTREPDNAAVEINVTPEGYWSSLMDILRQDANFRWYLAARSLSQLAVMGFAFYTVYVVSYQQVGEAEVGVMTGVFMGTQIIANPVMGRLGDRWSYRGAMQVGIIAAMLSALLAWRAPSPGWFYLVFILAGIAAVNWTVSLSMTLEFGSEAERPAYIGLANTLIAPTTILSPFVGGWLADLGGYPVAFLATAIGGAVTLFVLSTMVIDPKRIRLRV
jgi:MFS family permease